MSIHVFVSHSTWPKPDLNPKLQSQVAAHAAFRQELCRQLKTHGIEVVVDEEIPVGRHWREFLFAGIAECRAAIILVNEQALYHSPWVDTEVKILGYRAFIEKKEFCLIVIPFGGVTGAQIAKHAAWEPVAIRELQLLPRHGLDLNDKEAVGKLFQQVVQILQQSKEAIWDDSTSGWLVSRLSSLLEFEAYDLKEIGKHLGVDSTGVDNVNVLRRWVAHALYCLGPTAITYLRENPHCNLTAVNLRKIVDILSTYWVDMTASIGLMTCCQGATSRKIVAINGSLPRFTPQAYLSQVWHLWTPGSIIVVDPTENVVEQIYETLLERFSEQLYMNFTNLKRVPRQEIMDFFNARLSSVDALPMFVVFLQQGGGLVQDVTEEILGTFPHIHVIVCTGTEPGEAILPPSIYMLKPELCLCDEKEGVRRYMDALFQVHEGVPLWNKQ